MGFCHLHVHNEYSVLDGFGKAIDFAKRAKFYKMSHLALTNHGNVDGVLEFKRACDSEGITPIYGVEAYIVQNLRIKKAGEKRNHINLLAKNETGFKNICKMLSIANSDGMYIKPRIDPNLLLENIDGVVILTACCASFINEAYGFELLEKLKTIGYEDLFFEIMPLKLEDQKKTNKKVIEYSELFGWDIVATNDLHYIKKTDHINQEVLLAINTKKRWSDPDRFSFSEKEFYMKSEKTMSKSFQKLGYISDKTIKKALSNTMKVAKLCESFKLDEKHFDLPLPKIFEKSKKTDYEILKELVFNELKNNRNKVNEAEKDVYYRRARMELKQIRDQDFSRYFLIVYDVVKYAKENEILVGAGRGSAGGSLVCYLLGITAIDPVRYNLLFARFVNPSRIDLPDIDVDFEDRRRKDIRKYLQKQYGTCNVVGVSTFSRMKGRSAIRDVSRVFDVPLNEVGKMCDCVVTKLDGEDRADKTIIDACRNFEDAKKFKEKYPDVVKIASSLEMQIRNKGQHASAMCVSNDSFDTGDRGATQFIGKKNDKNLCVCWEKTDIEHFGIMKLDILGLNNLTILSEARRLIKQRHGVNIDFESLPIDDKKCYEEFSKGNNIGCFQVGSPGLRQFCKKMGVNEFMDIVHATSLYRPGTLKNGMAEEFVKIKNRAQSVKKIHPIYDEITEGTNGIILYQEQIMLLTVKLAGFDWKKADKLRKVISKSQGSDAFNEFKEDFINGCVENKTLNEQESANIFDILSSFGSYSFNLSHAVAYSYITYWDMWVKLNYPIEFFCANLTYLTSQDKKDEIIQDLHRLGIELRPPKIGISHSDNWVIHNDILYTPISEIFGVGEVESKKIYKNYQNKGSLCDEEIKITDRFKKILNSIYYFDDVPVTEKQADEIEEYFKISYSKDQFKKINNLFDKIKPYTRFISLLEINREIAFEEEFYFYGRMKNINFKFNSEDGSTTVYGVFEDSTDYIQVNFNKDLYQEKKESIEHSEGKFCIVKANYPYAGSSLKILDFYSFEDLTAGDFIGLDLGMAKKKKLKEKSIECDDCKMSDKLINAKSFDSGVFNAMIVEETSFYSEETLKYLKHFDVNIRDIHRTSVLKCHNPKVKPGKREINHCEKYIEAEIKELKPFVILAFGNIGLRFFTGQESGIIDKNGVTEWSQKYNCWVCYCVSPRMIYHNEKNKEMFLQGLENFVEKLLVLGFGAGV